MATAFEPSTVHPAIGSNYVSISNNNLTMTVIDTDGNQSKAWTVDPFTKNYIEASLDVLVGWAGAVAIGISNKSHTSWMGDTGSFGCGADGNAPLDTVTLFDLLPGSDMVEGDRWCMAVDRPNNLAWIRINNGNWNANSSANPALGLGGFSISSLPAGNLFPVMYLDIPTTGQVTIHPSPSNWTYTAPSGFSQVGYNTSLVRDLLKFSQVSTLPKLKSMTILDPLNTDNLVLFKASENLTLKEVKSIVRGTSPSTTFTLYKGPNRNGTGNTVMQSGIVCTNTTTGVSTVSFSSSTVSAGDYVWVAVTATSGTVNELHMTLRF